MKNLKPESISEQRINRILSLSGVSSRRNADDLISSGRVMKNDLIVKELGVKAFWGKDSIKVDGQEIPGPSFRTYILINKPFGYICSLNDPEGRPVVTDLIRDIEERVYPVGRLDFDSLGLLILTNDGEFAHRMTHPKYRIPKTYKVTVKGNVTPEVIDSLKKGVELEDGFSGPAKVDLIQRSDDKSVMRMTITVGKNRIIRRMLEALGLRTVHLIRTGFGNLELKDLKIGKYRHLEGEEVMELKKMVGLR